MISQRYWTAAMRQTWWNDKRKEYPFHARVPSSIKPHHIQGDHASIPDPERIGWRIWGWKTADERDRFCASIGSAEAIND